MGTVDNTAVRIWDKRVKYYWQDKAGGYGIQTPFGKKAVKCIRGDYYTIVGLPVRRLAQMLNDKFGFDISLSEVPMYSDIFPVNLDVAD